MKLPSLVSILTLLPSIYRAISADLAAARAAGSDGGSAVTKAEAEAIAADIGIRLSAGLVPLVAAVNGL